MSFFYTGHLETIKDITKGKLFINGYVPRTGEYSLIISAISSKEKGEKKEPIASFLVKTKSELSSGNTYLNTIYCH